MRKPTAVIIGYGRMGREHERAYQECGVDQIVAADRETWREGIDTLRPDYASVCSYDDAHADQICYALERGHKVIAEKPLCLTEDDLKRIYKLATPETLYCNLPLLEKEWPDVTGAHHIQADYNWGRADQIKGWRSQCPGYSFVLGAGVHMASLVMKMRGAIAWVEAEGVANHPEIDCHTWIDVEGGFVRGLKGDGAEFGIIVDCDDVGEHSHYVRVYKEDETISLSSRATDKTAGIKRFIEGKYDRYHNSFAAHSVCFAIERALKSGKRETVEYLS